MNKGLWLQSGLSAPTLVIEMDSDDEDYQYSDGGTSDENENEIDANEASFRSALTEGSGDKRSRSGSSPGEIESGRNSLSDGGYRLLEAEDAAPIFTALVNEVASLLDMDTPQVEILLRSEKWNKEKLNNSYFEDPEKCKEKCGLKYYDRVITDRIKRMELKEDGNQELRVESVKGEGGEEERDDGGNFNCRICRVEQPNKEAIYMGCNHRFCADCYRGYVVNAVASGPACILSKCPEHKCEEALPSTVFEKLCDEESFKRYQKYMLHHYVDRSKTMRFCPAPGCDKIAMGSGIYRVSCDCGHNFCFKCGEETHEPSSCAQLQLWEEKCQSESETANWIIVNTKKCPKCDSRIEKNQGCNHMHCKLCHHDFCWMCMQPWSEHDQSTGGYYKCNRFDPSKPDGDGDNANKAKYELDRYLHYYQRYHGHDGALKYAHKDRIKAEQRMLERQETDKSTWMEVQFLKNATDQVIECRRVLKYTYVMGFFLQDNTPEKQLFEHHQEMLEKHTEMLHELTEMPVEQLEQSHVVNMTRVTDKFLTGLLQTCTGGYINSGAAGATPQVAGGL